MSLPARSLLRQPRLFSRTFTTPSIPSSSSSASLPPSTPAEAPHTPSGESSTAPSSSIEKYRIPRTASGELPVYSKLRRGNMWKTVVRNVEGDVGSLQSDLNALFQQTHIDPLRPAPVVTVRPTNQHLEVKGRWVPQVKEWLEGRGF